MPDCGQMTRGGTVSSGFGQFQVAANPRQPRGALPDWSGAAGFSRGSGAWRPSPC